MSQAIRSFVLSILICVCATPGRAEDASREQMKGLDEQVQEVKSDVLSIAAELNQLEEKLLYPSDTHVAVFVSLAQGETFRLDAVQVQIDGQLAAHYIYTFKELEALQKGRRAADLHREHRHRAARDRRSRSTASSRAARTTRSSERFPFSKGIGPKLIGVTLAGPDSGKPAIDVGDWH